MKTIFCSASKFIELLTPKYSRNYIIKSSVLNLIASISFYHAEAQIPYPMLQNVRIPASGIAAPGDAFVPPMSGVADGNTPTCAEWTRTAGVDESLLITGSKFTNYSALNEGKDTRFTLFGKNGLSDAKIQRIDSNKVVVTIKKDLLTWGMYLLWPRNENGYGYPVAINKTDSWWVGPAKTHPGECTSIYGRNLSHNNDTLSSFVYIKPYVGAGQWAIVTKVNPYKVDFIVPSNLLNGEYEVWIHNGHGGDFGWGGPLKITIRNYVQWSNAVFNVKNYGAKGDGFTDDTRSILEAIKAAEGSSESTVYFPTGVYLVSNTLYLKNNMRYRGEDVQSTLIKCASNFSENSNGLLFAQSLSNLEIEGLTLEGNHNYKGNLNSPIWFRNSTDVRINNMRFSFQDYHILDLHEARNFSVKNCQFIGSISFLGNCSQLFIDSCNFKLTNDADAALISWGGIGVSLTNSTCQDLDNSNPNNGSGWGKGRFFLSAGNFGSSRHTYIGNNITLSLATRNSSGVDQNSGEQFLWEGNRADWMGSPLQSTAVTATLANFSYSNQSRYAVIIKGKGIGQSRRIVDYRDSVITLETPWNDIPDVNSTIVIGSFADRIVVYRNYLSGKPYTVMDNNLFIIGSTGVEPYGGVLNFVADNNTIKELRSGLANWVTQHEIGVDPNYFSLFANNKLLNCRWGIQNGLYNVNMRSAVGTGMLGATYRNNIIDNTLESAIVNTISDTKPSELDGFIYEHNNFINIKKGFSTGDDSGVPPWFPTEGQGIENLIFYKNSFNSNSIGTFGIKITPKIALRENKYQGFNTLYSGLVKPIIEAPYHVIELKGNTGEGPVQSKITLWNSGTSILQWSAAKNAAWVSLSTYSGIIFQEGDSNIINFHANPYDLFPGDYTADITVTCGMQSKVYQIVFKVLPPFVTLHSKLLAFYAKRINNDVVLSWETTNTSNNKGFDVERSFRGVSDFKKIGFVPAITNNAPIKFYEFRDQNPPLKKIYYRLKQWDIDNKFVYSNVLAVTSHHDNDISIYPNPTSDFLHLDLNPRESGLMTVLFFDINGTQVHEKFSYLVEKGTLSKTIDLSLFPKGSYVVKIKYPDNEETTAMFIKG